MRRLFAFAVWKIFINFVRKLTEINKRKMKKLKRLKRFSILALMVVGAQVTWGQTDLSFNCSRDNSSAISSNAGNKCNVTLSGRTLYRDGDWNTLCLPFGVTKAQIDVESHPLHGATIKELLTTSNLDNYGTLTLNFNTVGAIVAGKPYIVRWDNYFTIRSAADWNTFANNVSEGNTYEGMTVLLADDIDIEGNMVGTTDKSFEGIFDGGGHTITCDIQDNSAQGVAPFFCIQDATIKNLKVTGSVNGALHCAGLVGFAFGSTNTITNCEVAVDVTCNSGDHCAGVLGFAQASGQSNTTITNCLYSGTITGGSAAVGIICGWSDSGVTTTISNCLANGTYNTTGTVSMIQGNGTNTETNCYQKSNESTSGLVSTLGSSNWQASGNYAVPIMATINNTIDNPVFSGVTIANTNIPTDVSFTGGTFKGNYSPLTINDTNRDKILLLTSGNKLGYAKDNATPMLNAFRAYFEIPVATDGSKAVRSFVLDFGDGEDTGITTTYFTDHTASDAWYSLDGRRLNRQPTVAGLYIHNGRKVIIK